MGWQCGVVLPRQAVTMCVDRVRVGVRIWYQRFYPNRTTLLLCSFHGLANTTADPLSRSVSPRIIQTLVTPVSGDRPRVQKVDVLI